MSLRVLCVYVCICVMLARNVGRRKSDRPQSLLFLSAYLSAYNGRQPKGSRMFSTFIEINSFVTE